MLSDKQSENSFSPTVFKSGLCNLKLHVTSGGMQKVL